MSASHVVIDTFLHAAETLLWQRKLKEAVDAFNTAERSGADTDRCSSGRWMAHTLAGEYAAAWRESDVIREHGGPDPHRFWQGEDIHGKRVILRCLHGLGDAVQMLRYLPMLRARCLYLVIEVPPRLVALAHGFAGADEVITWGEAAPAVAPAWDVQIEVMELPYFFRTVVADLPLATSYVQLPAAAVNHVSQAIGVPSKPRVGIVWSASEWDRTRCLPMSCVMQIVQTTGIEFWNLQGGGKHDEASGDPALKGVHDAAIIGPGVVTLAAVIAQLDLVITVDTLAAHLAGALAKPAWILLQHAADWRWMHASDDSPWYPTLSLFRQPTQDDWSGLTTRVCGALITWRGEIT